MSLLSSSSLKLMLKVIPTSRPNLARFNPQPPPTCYASADCVRRCCPLLPLHLSLHSVPPDPPPLDQLLLTLISSRSATRHHLSSTVIDPVLYRCPSPQPRTWEPPPPPRLASLPPIRLHQPLHFQHCPPLPPLRYHCSTTNVSSTSLRSEPDTISEW
ncbi:hypothetical protein CRG98_012444 [Punica granatum]|uniref:Uncharacterized protein n=1 Tax=Punica granatum TaxID=22663 RepID=A0A2I0KFA9_PUNGR|nr:hypothetical protein CRG98_012444 [Punica granatum]